LEPGTIRGTSEERKPATSRALLPWVAQLLLPWAAQLLDAIAARSRPVSRVLLSWAAQLLVPWEAWLLDALVARGRSVSRVLHPWVDAAAPGRGGRRGCPVSRSGEWRAEWIWERSGVDLGEEQRAGSGAAPGRSGRRLLVSGGRWRWDGFGRGALGG